MFSDYNQQLERVPTDPAIFSTRESFVVFSESIGTNSTINFLRLHPAIRTCSDGSRHSIRLESLFSFFPDRKGLRVRFIFSDYIDQLERVPTDPAILFDPQAFSRYGVASVSRID